MEIALKNAFGIPTYSQQPDQRTTEASKGSGKVSSVHGRNGPEIKAPEVTLDKDQVGKSGSARSAAFVQPQRIFLQRKSKSAKQDAKASKTHEREKEVEHKRLARLYAKKAKAEKSQAKLSRKRAASRSVSAARRAFNAKSPDRKLLSNTSML